MSHLGLRPPLAAVSDDDWLQTIAVLGVIVTLVVMAALVVGVVTSRMAAFRAARQSRREAAGRGEGAYGFPVVTGAAASDGPIRTGMQGPIPVQEVGRGPGRYRIVGVVAATGTDIQMYVNADTPANAKVKAELKGVVVTEVEKQ